MQRFAWRHYLATERTFAVVLAITVSMQFEVLGYDARFGGHFKTRRARGPSVVAAKWMFAQQAEMYPSPPLANSITIVRSEGLCNFSFIPVSA